VCEILINIQISGFQLRAKAKLTKFGAFGSPVEAKSANRLDGRAAEQRLESTDLCIRGRELRQERTTSTVTLLKPVGRSREPVGDRHQGNDIVERTSTGLKTQADQRVTTLASYVQ